MSLHALVGELRRRRCRGRLRRPVGRRLRAARSSCGGRHCPRRRPRRRRAARAGSACVIDVRVSVTVPAATPGTPRATVVHRARRAARSVVRGTVVSAETLVGDRREPLRVVARRGHWRRRTRGAASAGRGVAGQQVRQASVERDLRLVRVRPREGRQGRRGLPRTPRRDTGRAPDAGSARVPAAVRRRSRPRLAASSRVPRGIRTSRATTEAAHGATDDGAPRGLAAGAGEDGPWAGGGVERGRCGSRVAWRPTSAARRRRATRTRAAAASAPYRCHHGDDALGERRRLRVDGGGLPTQIGERAVDGGALVASRPRDRPSAREPPARACRWSGRPSRPRTDARPRRSARRASSR